MFEAIDKKLGEYGTIIVDFTKDLKLKVAIGLELDILAELKKLAEKTKTPWDDKAIEWLEAMLKKKDD